MYSSEVSGNRRWVATRTGGTSSNHVARSDGWMPVTTSAASTIKPRPLAADAAIAHRSPLECRIGDAVVDVSFLHQLAELPLVMALGFAVVRIRLFVILHDAIHRRNLVVGADLRHAIVGDPV